MRFFSVFNPLIMCFLQFRAFIVLYIHFTVFHMSLIFMINGIHGYIEKA